LQLIAEGKIERFINIGPHLLMEYIALPESSVSLHRLEMTIGMGFPMGMEIPWDSHGYGNW